jgi:hypothetical protein
MSIGEIVAGALQRGGAIDRWIAVRGVRVRVERQRQPIHLRPGLFVAGARQRELGDSEPRQPVWVEVAVENHDDREPPTRRR